MDNRQFFAVAFRQFVNNALRKQKLTPSALHKATGLSKSYVSKLCSPKTPEPPLPSIDAMHSICLALGFDVAKVLYAITQQMPEPEHDIRIRKPVPPASKFKLRGQSAPARSDKPRFRVKVSGPTETPEAPPVDTVTEADAFELIANVNPE